MSVSSEPEGSLRPNVNWTASLTRLGAANGADVTPRVFFKVLLPQAWSSLSRPLFDSPFPTRASGPGISLCSACARATRDSRRCEISLDARHFRLVTGGLTPEAPAAREGEAQLRIDCCVREIVFPSVAP